MDTLTQITLGAAIGELTLGRKVGNKALLWGGVAGLIPDLDILATIPMDDLSRMAFHRSVTHSLFFAVLFAPLLGYLIYRIYGRRETSWREWSQLAFWSTVTHPLLDCFTAYGTQLFWPFSHYRIAWNTIFVIDPLYSVPFGISVLVLFFLSRGSKLRRRILYLGLLVSTSYLSLTVVNKLYVTHHFRQQLQRQGIEAERLLTGPTPLNNILWRGVARTAEGFYTGYYSLLQKEDTIRFRFTPANKGYIQPYLNSAPLQTFNWITGGFFAVEKREGSLLLQDMRYGRLFGWAINDGAYIFSFRMEILPKTSGGQEIRLVRMRPPLRFNRAALSTLWQRIFTGEPPDSSLQHALRESLHLQESR